MAGKCRLSTVVQENGLNRVHVVMESEEGTRYRLNTQGNEGEVTVLLYNWAKEYISGEWVRHQSAFYFLSPDDALAFVMRWQGADIPLRD